MKENKVIIRAIIVYTLYVLGLGLLQVTLPHSVALFGARPDLTLILAVLAGYMFGSNDGMIIGLAAGFLRDMMAGRALGLGMLLLMYAGLLASVLLRKFFRRNIIMGLVQIIIATVFYQILITVLHLILPMLPDVTFNVGLMAFRMLQNLPAQLLVNSAAGIPMILLMTFMGPYRRGSRRDDPEQSIVGDSLWHIR